MSDAFPVFISYLSLVGVLFGIILLFCSLYKLIRMKYDQEVIDTVIKYHLYHIRRKFFLHEKVRSAEYVYNLWGRLDSVKKGEITFDKMLTDLKTIKMYTPYLYNKLKNYPFDFAANIIILPSHLIIDDYIFQDTTKTNISNVLDNRCFKTNRRLKPYLNMCKLVDKYLSKHSFINSNGDLDRTFENLREKMKNDRVYQYDKKMAKMIRLTKFKIFLDFIRWLTWEKYVILQSKLLNRNKHGKKEESSNRSCGVSGNDE